MVTQILLARLGSLTAVLTLGRGSMLPIDMSRPTRLEANYIILVDVHNLHAYFFYP